MHAFLAARGNPRKKILIPDSAHGTNPASAHMAGYEVEPVPSNARGMVDVEALARAVNEDTAGMMVTNPNTLGVFEQNIAQVAEILHAKGGLLYMDGANMNALAGLSRPGDFGVDLMHLNLHKTFSTPHGGGGPGSGPVAVKRALEPFLPHPRLRREGSQWAWSYDVPAVDRPRPRLLRQFRSTGARPGLHHGSRRRRAAASHVGRAPQRQLRSRRCSSRITRSWPTRSPACTRCGVQRRAPDSKRGVNTGAIAKRLIDYGFHPYTVAFPLIVKGALMIEPTETESKRELDLFCDAMISIAKEVEETPDLVKSAPHTTRTAKVDEVTAARKPIVRWKRV